MILSVLGLDADQSTAFFVLVGVVLGGVLNGTVTWFLERGRERSASRAAARLVHAEIAKNVQVLSWVVDTASTEHAPIMHSQWKANEKILARAVNDEAWTALTRAYVGIDRTEFAPPNWYEAMESDHEAFVTAEAALAPYVRRR